MHAVIHSTGELGGAGMAPIAGRPLIARQLQWLRASGHSPVAVELGPDAVSAEVGTWLREEDAIGAGVVLIESRRPLTPREIGRRAGFPEGAPLLSLPANVAVGGDLGPALAEAGNRNAVVVLDPPEALGGELEGGEIRVVAGEAKELLVRSKSGWAVLIGSLGAALALGVTALSGRANERSTGILVHAAEIEPGIWVGRGALIETGADLRAPALIGAGAVVRAGALVGPSVCVGERAVIEAGTTITGAMIEAGTIVGEGLALRGVAVDSEGVSDLLTGERVRVDDPLVLARRDAVRPERLAPQVMELVLLVVVTPVALLAERVSMAFADQALGSRSSAFERAAR